MTEPLLPPKRRNPLARTSRPLLPAGEMSRTAQGLTRAAAEGRFALQRCAECGCFCYPARDACPHCLSDRLVFKDAPAEGELLSRTTLHLSAEPYFRERMPWRIGLVRLACGPRAVAHLHGDCPETGPVRLALKLDKASHPVLFALPIAETQNMSDDRQLREMTADPKHRRILVTDAASPVAAPLAKALLRAGARHVFAGAAAQWRDFASLEALHGIDNVEIVDLDLADERSVAERMADLGAKIDIVINTADHVRPGSLFEPGSTRRLGEALEATVLGAARLARHLGPVMAARGADGTDSAAAWVNLLSVHALAADPQFGAMSVAHAANLSFSHWLRSELGAGGVRVLNVFSGPLDTEWFQTVPPPKVAPKALADAVVKGLREGLEELYVGDVAKDLRERLATNPKAVEREAGR